MIFSGMDPNGDRSDSVAVPRGLRPTATALLLQLLLLLLVLVPVPRVHGADERPNILFAFADDWGRYASAYARIDGPGTVNDLIRTPNVDRIAQQGVLFRHAFVSAPSCTPCRSAVLSGQPFCFWFGPTNPHRSWEPGSGKALWGIDPEQLRRPASAKP